MAHCPYERLRDLEDSLERVRSWDSVREKSPGVFYLRSKPFLHFHVWIVWLDASTAGPGFPGVSNLLERFDRLRLGLNRELFLG